LQHNRSGWNRWARSGGEWSQPYSAERLEAARQGNVHVVLTPNKRVPADWLGILKGKAVLGLASGGGQQMPLFAAAGAQVTSFDLSDAQLARDSAVADAHGLDIRTVQGNMADLSALPSEHFDLIFHPVSNVFAPDLKPVWAEAFRVLKPGGRMLSGMMQPVFYCFDHQELDEGGPLTLRYSVPYSDLEQLPKERLEAWIASGEVLEFGHSLQDLLGLPLEAGFAMTGFYDDNWSDAHSRLNPYFPIFLATRLIKPVG
jgi:SAM-dependent methyltransferase